MKKSMKQTMRAKSAEDLIKESEELRSTMLKNRLSTTLEGKRLSIQHRGQRRQIARILTVLREREIAAAKGKAH
ncbi:MAG: 50S ribosomal protein L29 [Planctomycetota bacterium]